jgi:hypothetical protein
MKRAVFICLSLFCYHLAMGQEFTEEQKKIVSVEAKKLIDNYKQFGEFSYDGKTILLEYINEFKKLFASNAKIVDDIDPNGKPDQEITIDKYIEKIKTFYPAGIRIMINKITPDNIINKISGKKYYTVLKIDKTMNGLYENKKFYSKTNQLFFKIEFEQIKPDQFNKFLISSVSANPFEQPKILVEKSTRNSVVLILAPSFSQIKNNIKDVTSSGSTTFGFKAEFSHFFTKNFSLGIGFGLASYKSVLNLANYQIKFNANDADNETYERRISGTAIKEEQELMNLTIPVVFRFILPLGNKTSFFLQGGVEADIPIGKTYKGSGVFSYSGYYATYNYLISNMPEFEFPSNKQLNKNGTLSVKSFSPIMAGGLGLIYNITDKIGLIIGASYQMSLSNLATEQLAEFKLTNNSDEYNSLIGSSTKTTIQSYGVQLGITLDF